MKKYKVKVTKSVHYVAEIVIEANSLDDAKDKADAMEMDGKLDFWFDDEDICFEASVFFEDETDIN